MKTLFRIMLLISIICYSVLGLFVLIPFAKEGSSWGDMPLFAGVIGAALALALIWWLAVGRSLPKALIGWAIVLPPLLAHGATVTSLAMARFEGQRLANTARIENYREQPIVWPGFDGPVGLEVSLELRHATGIDALILPPEIRMGPALDIALEYLSASRTGGSGYLKNYYLDEPAGDLTLLKAVLFQRVFENPGAKHPNYKWTAAVGFSDSDSTALTYFLLPGAVDYLPDRNQICLNSRSYGIVVCVKDQKPDTGCASPNHRRATEPVYSDGRVLSAIWMAAGAYDMTADLGAQFTAALRKHGGLQSNPADWRAIQKRLEPDSLVKAGYGLCPAGADSHTNYRTCYCKAD